MFTHCVPSILKNNLILTRKEWMSTLPAEISEKVQNPLLHNLGVAQKMGAPRLKAKVKMPALYRR
jgi:hypothetical protein